ncbi:MAG: hypothetical protein DRO40_10455 [Thermoprotei archaeon]|nr:MAG: hypothetical protein DRO40_10455 [Thermoprotei archaeon]
MIVVTCKYYRIITIVTSDKDFKGIPRLKIMKGT